jgi:hypothetical protein
MNSVQYLNPDLEIPNNLARFIKKWGFIRMPNSYHNHPCFLKATRNNVFELFLSSWKMRQNVFCYFIFLNEEMYNMDNPKVIKALKESR